MRDQTSITEHHDEVSDIAFTTSLELRDREKFGAALFLHGLVLCFRGLMMSMRYGKSYLQQSNFVACAVSESRRSSTLVKL